MEKDFFKKIDHIIAECVANCAQMDIVFPGDSDVIKGHICLKAGCRPMTWRQIEASSCKTTREQMQILLKSAYIERYCIIHRGITSRSFEDIEHFIYEAKKVLIECGIKELV